MFPKNRTVENPNTCMVSEIHTSMIFRYLTVCVLTHNTVNVQNPNVQILALLKVVWLLNRSDFERCLIPEPFRSDFERSVG